MQMIKNKDRWEGAVIAQQAKKKISLPLLQSQSLSQNHSLPAAFGR
jgi:hypothetical protein